MIVLGVHRDPWHNTGAAIIREYNNKIDFVNIAEERLNREKDSRKFPALSVSACMKEFNILSFEDIDKVVLDYIIKKDWLEDYSTHPSEKNTFLEKIDPSKIHVINHHLAHAYNTFYSSPFESAAILIVDGRGSNRETQSLFMATQNGIELIESTTRIGIGLLYAAVTQSIGFGLLQEGKTMGLAPYGANISKQIFNFPHIYEGIATDYSSICIEDSYELKIDHPSLDSFEAKARAAYEVQCECESALFYLAEYAKKKTGADNLCISGGVGLNSVTNYKILQSNIFKDVFINPAASDTGIPLGAALYGYHTLLNRKKSYCLISPYLGPTYYPTDCIRALNGFRGTTYNPCSYEGFKIIKDNPINTAIDLLVQNKIIACFHGRSEMGPRALGNRSILMSPIIASNKDVLNNRVKHRESFRPFAPAILNEYTREYFEINHDCPYMLFVPNVKKEKQAVIPAVTHTDGTGRLQTVNKEDNPYFYALIEKFYQRTGVPVILNTSFNVANEPIVESPEDAIRCFLSTEIDALLLEDILLQKENF